MQVYQNGRFVENVWTELDDAAVEAGTVEGRVIVSLSAWRAHKDALVAQADSVGVKVQPGDEIDAEADDLDRLALVSVVFPKFSDGRGYSTARLLADRHAFRGELRAEGEVLLDQIPLMMRCGFTSFAVTNSPTIAALQRGEVPAVNHVYQAPAAGSRWRRRFELDTRELRAAE